ncbi:MAG TPA: DUF2203 domain-containing protein [Ktedonobacterales bacterium]
MPPKYFTRTEAEALLPTVAPLLRDIREWRAELLHLGERLAELRAKAMGNGHSRPDDDDPRALAKQLEQRISDALATINALGIEVKDLEMGLIDFPSLREDRVIYLCWRLGEDRIAWWHELAAGFAGRTPLEEDE